MEKKKIILDVPVIAFRLCTGMEDVYKRQVYTQDFFYKLFTEAEESGKIVFEESPEQNIYFLCMDDLAELLYKVYDNWGKDVYKRQR